MDSVGLCRAQGRMFFRRPVVQHRKNCRSATSTRGCTISHFQLQSTPFDVYREAQLESKRKRYTFAANNGEVKLSLLYICVFEWGNCCKSLGPGS